MSVRVIRSDRQRVLAVFKHVSDCYLPSDNTGYVRYEATPGSNISDLPQSEPAASETDPCCDVVTPPS